MDSIPDNLRTYFRHGAFSFFIECSPPGKEQPYESAMESPRRLARSIAGRSDITGITVSDRRYNESCHDILQVAEELQQASQKPVILHLSGKRHREDDIQKTIQQAENKGIKHFFIVSGDATTDLTASSRSPRIPYTESTHALNLCKASDRENVVGVAVNPFKYTPQDQFLQYLKLVRKYNSGADYVVTQTGWDMKKLQEFQWYLQMRELPIPAIVRISLLRKSQIDTIHETSLPGITLPRTLAALFQREAHLNTTQALAAQLQRAALQLTGIKYLGYSGIQLNGIHTPEELDMFFNRFGEVNAEIASFQEWTQRWEEHHNITFSPVPRPYYVFRNLLETDTPLYDSEKCPRNPTDIPMARKTDRSLGMAGRILARTIGRSRERVNPLLSFLFPGRKFSEQELRQFFYLLPNKCPKQLAMGSCGNSTPYGLCELGHDYCFFRRVLTLAADKHALDRLEESV